MDKPAGLLYKRKETGAQKKIPPFGGIAMEYHWGLFP
jgi:hypothetical protein